MRHCPYGLDTLVRTLAPELSQPALTEERPDAVWEHTFGPMGGCTARSDGSRNV